MGCSPSSQKNDEGEKVSDQQQQPNQQQHHVSLNSHKIMLHQQSAAGTDKQQNSGEAEREKPISDGNLISLGPMSIFRPRQLNVVAAFARDDPLFNALQAATQRLKWSFKWIKPPSSSTGTSSSQASGSSSAASMPNPGAGSQASPSFSWKSLTDQLGNPSPTMTIDLLLLDYRSPKLLPSESLDVIKSLKAQNIALVAVAFVKKSFFDKSETAVNFLLEAGIDKVEIDHGITSHCFWINELSQLEKSFVDAAYKLITTDALITALDQCRDLIQITDSHHRIQFVNQAYEKLLGFHSSEVVGSDFVELQNRVEQSWSRQSPVPPSDYNRAPTPTTGTMMPITSAANQPARPEPTSPTTPLPTYLSTANPPQSLHDHVLLDLSQGKLWEGNYMYSRKTGDPIFLNSRVFPYSTRMRSRRRSSATLTSPTRPPNDPSSPTTQDAPMNKDRVNVPAATHYIYVCDAPTAYREKSFSSDITSAQDAGYNPMPRGSLKSLRKASYDIKSISNDTGSILRRQSLAKLHSLTIEAPITKVINIIAAAQQSCPIYIAQALEKVLEILRTTEIYSPQFFDGNRVRSDDPLTTDLLGALLSQGPKPASITGRRSSNENTAARLAPRPSLPDIAEAPSRLQRLLETEARWDFDVLLLEEITEKRPLVWTGMAIFSRFGVAQTLNTDETTLRNWLTLIEANYHSSNTYHNSTHAADVLQATAYFMTTERLKTFLEPLDEVVALIAAVVHDVDHPGKTSGYLTNSGNELSLLYNDVSILESHHAAFAFKLTLSDPRVNIFKGLDTDTYKTVRRSIIDMVLATEMTKHFEHLSKFVNVFTKPLLNKEEAAYATAGSSSGTNSAITGPAGGNPSPLATTPTEPDISTLLTPDNVILIKRMLIKCADVANPTRPLKLCVEWAKRIAEEYFRQTDEEILRGLPPVMPMFERDTCSIPKSQTGFVDYFVADMFEAWDAFLDVPVVIDNMKYNYEFWKELDRQGIQSAGQVEAYIRKNENSTNSK